MLLEEAGNASGGGKGEDSRSCTKEMLSIMMIMSSNPYISSSASWIVIHSDPVIHDDLSDPPRTLCLVILFRSSLVCNRAFAYLQDCFGCCSILVPAATIRSHSGS